MSRIRTIKPEFWTSEQVVNLQPLARLLFIGMWNFCDDAGNIPASGRSIKMQVFPGDDFSVETIESLLSEIESEGLIARYTAEGKQYLHVTGWSSHQRVDKPAAKYPPFLQNSATIRRPFGDHSANPPLLPPCGEEGKGKEGKGKEGSGHANEISSEVLDPETIIRNWAKENLESLKGWASQAAFTEAHGLVRDEITKFCAHYGEKAEIGRSHRFKSDPVAFFRKTFKAWLIDAVRYNTPRTKENSKGNANLTVLPVKPTREAVTAHLQTAHSGFCGEITERDIGWIMQAQNLQEMRERCATKVKERINGMATPRSGPTTLLNTTLQPTAP